jgi:hypothetical protein
LVLAKLVVLLVGQFADADVASPELEPADAVPVGREDCEVEVA